MEVNLSALTSWEVLGSLAVAALIVLWWELRQPEHMTTTEWRQRMRALDEPSKRRAGIFGVVRFWRRSAP